jgi:hypothetical protein
VQRREQERAARKRERSIRRQECREQRSEEFWLHEQQGLSSPGTEEYLSSARRRRREAMGPGSPREVGAFTPSPRAAEAAAETVPGAGARAPAARQPTREATRAAEVLARAA